MYTIIEAFVCASQVGVGTYVGQDVLQVAVAARGEHGRGARRAGMLRKELYAQRVQRILIQFVWTALHHYLLMLSIIRISEHRRGYNESI